MNDMTRKVRDLHFNDDVLTSVFDYTGKEGIVVDNNTREIYADYDEMPFALPSDVEAVQANVDEVSTSLSDYALSDDVDNIISGLSGDIDNIISGLSGDVDNIVSGLSDDVSGIISSLSDDVDSIASDLLGRDEALSNWANDTFVDRSTDQQIFGYKAFRDGLDVGERIKDVGNNCFAVGNDLTVGSYNFFYKGIDIYDDGHALVYLTTEQPRYPFPFVIYNGDKNNFKILGNVVTVSDTSTYSALSAGTNLSRIWNCTLDPNPEHITNANHVWRADYNQLCMDLGIGYQENLDDVKERLESYIEEAFEGDQEVCKYLEGKDIIGQTITMVNGDKIAYLRCGTVEGNIGDNVLCVRFNETALTSSTGFQDGSRGFSDFDYDDASLVLIDMPLLSGPANTSTYSSMNVGVLNEVLRRGSMVCGKQLTSEADFAIAFGRRGKAQHYATFLWAPAPGNVISTDKSNTFNIGLNASLANAHAYKANISDSPDIRIIGSNNERERLYQYVWGCLSSDPNLKNEFKAWLGIA